MSGVQSVPATNNSAILLEEYKVCSSRADQLTTLMWSLVTALLSLNAGGLLFAGQLFGQTILEKSGQNLTPMPVIAAVMFSEIVASVSIFVLQWWNRVANRWNSYMSVWYHRMREIEEELGMWANRDINILDASTDKLKIFPEKEQGRSEVLEKMGVTTEFKKYSRESIRSLRDALTRWASVAWLFLVLVEVALGMYILSTLHYECLLPVGVVLVVGMFFVGWLVYQGFHSKKNADKEKHEQ